MKHLQSVERSVFFKYSSQWAESWRLICVVVTSKIHKLIYISAVSAICKNKLNIRHQTRRSDPPDVSLRLQGDLQP